MRARITGAGRANQTLCWNPGKPNESGYYMAAWSTQSGQRISSELWFNAGDGVGRWWATRGYLEGFGGQSAFMTKPIETVYAWADLPEAPDSAWWPQSPGIHPGELRRSR